MIAPTPGIASATSAEILAVVLLFIVAIERAVDAIESAVPVAESRPVGAVTPSGVAESMRVTATPETRETAAPPTPGIKPRASTPQGRGKFPAALARQCG